MFKQFEEDNWDNKAYSMSFSTPYDFFGTYETAFAMSMTEEEKNKTLRLIDYSLSIPELFCLPAEVIFFSVLLTVHKIMGIDSFYSLRQTIY